MKKAEKPIVLLGSMPGQTPLENFRIVAEELGDLPIGYADGEFNERRFWVVFVGVRAWEIHPDLETVRRSKGLAGMPRFVPAGYGDFNKYKVRDGLTSITVPTISFPVETRSSYLIFRNLRDQGIIPKNERFQLSIPFPEDAARLFSADARSQEIMANAYADAVLRDVLEILEDIPPDDFVLQWDINWETLAIAFDDFAGEEPMEYKCIGDPRERYVKFIRQLCKPIPREVILGLHLCYGDLHHRHFLEPKTLATCVEMANVGVKEAGRRIDFVHMPVPRARHDDEYFAPLKDLKIGDTTLYIGLVHMTDGLEGTMRRFETFRKYFDGTVGVGTECGLGRRPESSIARLLQIHREVVDAI